MPGEARLRQAGGVFALIVLAALTGVLSGREAGRLAKEEAPERLVAGEVFSDCPVCPQMVVVPPGSYKMGSPPSEDGRYDSEGPVHEVHVAGFSAGIYEVTRVEYSHFVSATGHSTESCYTFEDGSLEERFGRDWRRPGLPQTNHDPVVCVDWHDARSYAAWLSRKTGRSYRLLSESEWEYVARAGTTTPFHYGETMSPEQANYNGDTVYGSGSKGENRQRTVAVGSFAANRFGLYDVHGNVWEWTQDCWSENYEGAPADGSARESGDCMRRILRGGCWYSALGDIRSATRYGYAPGLRYSNAGFRIARTLTP